MADEIKRLITEASNKGQAYDLSEEISSNQSDAATMGDVINRRYGNQQHFVYCEINRKLNPRISLDNRHPGTT